MSGMKKNSASGLINRRSLLFIVGISLVLLAGYVVLWIKPSDHVGTVANKPGGAGVIEPSLRVGAGAPTSPPVKWCETGLPKSPYTSAPPGAITVPVGDNSRFNFSTPNTVYWFAPGLHTIGAGEFSQISVGHGDIYAGGPGAVLDGQGKDKYAFVGTYNDTSDQKVTIEYLTIQNFAPDQGGGAVNGNGNNGWTEKHNLMKNNGPGAAMMLGGDNVVTDNCLTRNGEYGFNGFSWVDENYAHTFTGGATNITFTGNDVSFNNTQRTSDGVEGGGKFWQNGNVTVTRNYFHDNIGSPGVWMDTNNAGFLVQDNYFYNNGREGLMYEISYNARIIHNTFVHNGISDGLEPEADFPTGAIYISESGGNSSVPSRYAGELNIQSNIFVNNSSGVVLYQNSNRYSGDGQDPGTLTPPPGVDLNTWINTAAKKNCPAHLSETTPVNYHSFCQWRTQNVTVQDNQFAFNPSDKVYRGKCSRSTNCGQNALFATSSVTSAYPGFTVCNAISNAQNNHFSDNAYTGPWTFIYFNQGDEATWTQWTSGLANVEGSGNGFGTQDAGSTFNSAASPAA
jgi:Right handed beta helix region